MSVYRIRVRAYNSRKYDAKAGGSPAMTFRYDINGYSPADALKRLPGTHRDDDMWYPEWTVESTYKRNGDDLRWSIQGVDTVSETSVKKNGLGRYATDGKGNRLFPDA